MRAVVVVVISMLAVAAVACGGDGESSNSQQGAAGFAVAQYFLQERDGGILPEGTEVRPVGGRPPTKLQVSGDESARYCVEYEYRSLTPPLTTFTRVYEAKLVEGAWEISVIGTDGGICESLT